MFSFLMKTLKTKGLLPKVSETERAALQAGTVWIDGELFSGKPDFARLLAEPYGGLEPEEAAFVAGPAEEICRRANAWEMAVTRELPEPAMAYLREQGFFGFNVPREYGGTPLGALAKSIVMGKMQASAPALGLVVTVPNSLGPAELLVHYGTDAQKSKYLPRLASGELIPCFGLTEPTAGSDAASIRAEAIAFRDDDGEVKLRLNFRKRYVTLAPMADLVSLAVRLEDPENLLGRGERPGITVVLLERGTPGFTSGEHHEPLVSFPNGPLRGKDVILPADAIIGGPSYAGEGWRMLMETLSAGRAISLPAGAVGAAKLAAATAGPYSMVRRQFGMPIGYMEGVQAKVAKLAALSYAMEAARGYGCAAIDRREAPPVISAIMKYRTTELARELVNDAMDVVAGAGIMRGPNNILAEIYVGLPMGVTVEGANILTRTLIVFGQGAIRCHPHAFPMVEAVEADDPAAFRRALSGWAGHFLATLGRATLRGLTRGHSAGSPVKDPSAKYYRRLGWASSRFALLTELALLGVGSRLKVAGNLSGRYADVLSWLFLATATLRRFEAEGRREEDRPLLDWALCHALAEIQRSFEGIYANFPVPLLGALLRGPGRAWLRLNPVGTEVPDRLNAAAARCIQRPGEQFERLLEHVHLPAEDRPGLGRLLKAFRLAARAEPVERQLRAAVKAGQIASGDVEAALAAQVITAEEAALLAAAETARAAAIEVDELSPGEYRRRMAGAPPADAALAAEA